MRVVGAERQVVVRTETTSVVFQAAAMVGTAAKALTLVMVQGQSVMVKVVALVTV